MPPRSTRDLEEAEFRITEMRDQLDELYGDEDDRVEDRPVGSVIAGLACGLGLSERMAPPGRRLVGPALSAAAGRHRRPKTASGAGPGCSS